MTTGKPLCSVALRIEINATYTLSGHKRQAARSHNIQHSDSRSRHATHRSQN
ncbi:hypothetical protein CBOM_00546 [Ceraceosorus bombacis]|uniref:Uncharacterized protein n=1 Tax=Ceraceosorus bombacis TaxID=401625 RepID=A0A0P1BAV2_9BASI|nr:hypothetical protein CBOM_00546 [Ceraceosorus bombacis]